MAILVRNDAGLWHRQHSRGLIPRGCAPGAASHEDSPSAPLVFGAPVENGERAIRVARAQCEQSTIRENRDLGVRNHTYSSRLKKYTRRACAQTFAFCVIIHEMKMCLRAAGRCFSTGARAGEARLLAAASGPPQRIVRRAEHLMVLAPRVSSNFEAEFARSTFNSGSSAVSASRAEHGDWSVLNHATVSCRMRCDETNDFAYFGGVSGSTRIVPVSAGRGTGASAGGLCRRRTKRAKKQASWRQTFAWSWGLTVTRRAPVQDQAKTKVCCCCCC